MMNAPTLKLKMKKSQAAIEFVIFVGVAVLVLMAYFWISNNYINMTYKQREIISGSDLVKELKNENRATMASTGSFLSSIIV